MDQDETARALKYTQDDTARQLMRSSFQEVSNDFDEQLRIVASDVGVYRAYDPTLNAVLKRHNWTMEDWLRARSFPPYHDQQITID